MQFFLYEVVARIVAIYLCVDCSRDLWHGLVERKIAYFNSDFLDWCLRGDLAKYYETMRWPGWREELSTVGGDFAFNFFPLLSCSGPPIEERTRTLINISEAYDMHVGRNS